MANMTFKASLIPNTNLGYSLGSSDKKWNIYGNLTGDTISTDALTAGSLVVTGNSSLVGDVTTQGKFTGDGSGLTNVNAAKVNSHTVAADVPSGAKFTDTVTTVTTSGSGNAITAISASNGAITATKGTTFLTAHNTYTVTTSGSGNAVTGISLSGTTFTVTKGSTFNNYSLPNATASTLGGVKIGSNITVSSGTISLTKDNVTAALGYTPPTSDTNTWTAMVGATSSANGSVGYVNAVPPKDGYNTKYLRADGTWAVPPDNNTTYSAGTGISLSGTTFSNSGVRSISTGSTNGTISVNTNGTSAEVAVKGLGSNAYTSTAYLPLTGGTLSGNLSFSGGGGSIAWNSGTVQQRIQIVDDNTANTNVFAFQQSTDTGSSWTNLATIKDNGQVVATTFVGDLSGTATTATNLASAPTLAASGTATVNLAANTTYTLTVGEKTLVFKTPADTNTTYTAATATPSAIGTAAVGTSAKYAREDHVHNISLASGDSAGQVKIAGTNVSVNGWANKANLASPTFTGTPKAPTATAGDNSTQIATTAFVTSAVTSLAGPMRFIGTLGTGGTATSLAAAAAANKGYAYKVITAGTYQSVAAKVGDMLVSTGSEWILIPSGDEPSGTVTNVATGTGLTGGPITSSGTISLADNYGDTKNPYASKTKNYVLAAPSDAAGAPTFRALAAADIPNLAASKITSGTLGVARGGTGAATFTSGAALIGNGTSAVTTRAITNNTAATAYASGSTNLVTMNTLYYGSASINNARQTSSVSIYAPTSAGTANQILVSAGGTAAPTWKATANGAAYATSANGALTFGTLPVAQGGTGQTSVANIKAGKDADGNTISSTYLKLSGGTMTGALTLNSLFGSAACYGDTLPETGTVGQIFFKKRS